MGHYIESHLTRGEHIVYIAKLSYIPLIFRDLRWFVLVSFIAGIIWGLFSFQYMVLAYCIGIFIIILATIPAVITMLGTEMIITNTSIHSKTGIIRVDNDRTASLDRIDRVDIDKHKFVQRLFDYGDIEFQTIGSDSGFFYFHNVSHPYEMRDAYNAAMVDYEKDLRTSGHGPRSNSQYASSSNPYAAPMYNNNIIR